MEKVFVNIYVFFNDGCGTRNGMYIYYASGNEEHMNAFCDSLIEDAIELTYEHYKELNYKMIFSYVPYWGKDFNIKRLAVYYMF